MTAKQQARDAGGDKTDQGVDRRVFSDDERASASAPAAVRRASTVDPAADVSNADIDINAVSLDSGHASHEASPDGPNPMNLRPAPGPSHVEVLGVPSGDPVENVAEEQRA